MSAETLSAMSDAELSEVFAVEVAQCKFGPMFSSEPDSTKAWSDAGGDWITDNEGQLCGPTFAASADAVLPWLNTAYIWRTVGGNDEDRKNGSQCYVGVSTRDAHHSNNLVEGEMEIEALAPTFPRAACIALILAKRKASK